MLSKRGQILNSASDRAVDIFEALLYLTAILLIRTVADEDNDVHLLKHEKRRDYQLGVKALHNALTGGASMITGWAIVPSFLR